MLQNYNFGQTEKVSIIKKWLGREGIQLIAMLKIKRKRNVIMTRVYSTHLIKNLSHSTMK